MSPFLFGPWDIIQKGWAASTGLMMRPEDDGISPRKRRRISSQATPYILRQLLDELPLAVEGPGADIYITCVEYWSKDLTRFASYVVLYQLD